jgi:hypothetical protein
MEELYYALDRALSAKGAGFPIFALLHNVKAGDLAPALKTRLCIPLMIPDWVHQVVATVRKKPAGFIPAHTSPVVITTHSMPPGFAIELRTRFEHLSPFILAVDLTEKARVTDMLMVPPGILNAASFYSGVGPEEIDLTIPDESVIKVWGWRVDSPACSPVSSAALNCTSLPNRVWFGKLSNVQEYPCLGWNPPATG